ncbi:hypothetical protein [Terrimonas pollutisoli]|uniref:hypothetical protein n=1 Tax=Terrimonas pollutisoli TaxID=3034147 RepID=UPI0023EB6CEF|nr:hypothetical protein [Terrimonas sp. H1YJ31]
MKSIYFLFVSFFTATQLFSVKENYNPNEVIYHCSGDTSIYKRYQSRRDSSSYGFSEKLELKKDSTFTYSLRADLIYKSTEGKWQIENGNLKLIDRDTSKPIIINEKFISTIPKGVKRFEISAFNGNDLGYDLYIKLKGNKFIKKSDSKRVLDVPVSKCKFFKIKSVKEYDIFFPKRKSNYFQVLINTQNALLEKLWHIDNRRIYPISNRSKGSSNYYLEEF